jgi:phospholipase A1/A2
MQRMLIRLLSAGALLAPLALHAQSPDAWQSCSALRDDGARLACFDRWAAGQQAPAAPVTQAPAPTPALPAAVASTGSPVRLTTQEGCRDTRYTALSRFWELERGSDCGTFGLRSLRPLVAAAAFADTVNRQPTSENPANNAATAIDYSTREMRLQLSVRSKLAQNLLAAPSSGLSDSIWFAYSQQSYWQLFTPGISRPFRSTDHEPELMYVYPLQAEAAGWRLRYGGAGIVHHSNGQSLPYSRSWNRVYLMAGAESGNVQLRGRIWRRIDEDRANDDNPNISDYFGRAELQASWRPNNAHLLSATVRHSLRRPGRGALRLEWFRTLYQGGDGGLQLYTQLFTGYGDTLLDYNRRRSVFSVGLSLAEW